MDKEYAYKQIEHTIAQQNAMKAVVDELPEMDCTKSIFIYEKEMCLLVPFSPENIERTDKVLAAMGFEKISEFDSTSTAAHRVCYKREREGTTVYLDVSYDPMQKGSTCKRNLIGYERPAPIYERVCLEA